jgi:hypothetical protein
MKINDILQQPSSLPVSKKADKMEGKEVDFQHFLNDARARRSEGHQATPPPSTSREVENLSVPVLSVPSLNGASETKEMNQIRSLGIKATEDTLGILEQYQKAIGDPRMTLRQMNSIVQSLSQEVKSLKTLAEKVPSSDPLQKIMTDLGIVSTVEIEKFSRGEYV